VPDGVGLLGNGGRRRGGQHRRGAQLGRRAESLPPEVKGTEGITCVAPSSCWALAETATAVVILALHPPS
jgi:hypothetical protein